MSRTLASFFESVPNIYGALEAVWFDIDVNNIYAACYKKQKCLTDAYAYQTAFLKKLVIFACPSDFPTFAGRFE